MVNICEVHEEEKEGGHLSAKKEAEQPLIGWREADIEEKKIGALLNAPETEREGKSRARRWPRHDALGYQKLRESAVLPGK